MSRFRISCKWPVERLESWKPSYTEGEILEVHAEGALRTLIWIAQRYDWGQAALDDYLDAGDEPQAAPPDDTTEEPSRVEQGGAGEDDLRRGWRPCWASLT